MADEAAAAWGAAAVAVALAQKGKVTGWAQRAGTEAEGSPETAGVAAAMDSRLVRGSFSRRDRLSRSP